jgi:hypothetical protein
MSLYPVSILDAHITQLIRTMTQANSFHSFDIPDNFTNVWQQDDLQSFTGRLTAEQTAQAGAKISLKNSNIELETEVSDRIGA